MTLYGCWYARYQPRKAAQADCLDCFVTKVPSPQVEESLYAAQCCCICAVDGFGAPAVAKVLHIESFRSDGCYLTQTVVCRKSYLEA